MEHWQSLFGSFAVVATVVVAFSLAFVLIIKHKEKTRKASFEELRARLVPGNLAHAGSDLSLDQVGEQERILSENPTNMKARALLLGYYDRPGRSSVDSKRYQVLALWIIEHFPEKPIAHICEFLPGRNFDDAYEQGKQLWLKHIDHRPKDTAILRHAATYFLLKDDLLAEKLLLTGKKLQPKNSEWSERLAHLYSLRLLSAKGDPEQSAERSLEEQERAYRLSHSAIDRLYILESLPQIAFNAGKFDMASKYAKSLIKNCSPDQPTAGDSLHKGHLILGRVALRNGDVEAAKSHLQSSADVEGSPVLSSFGPSMILAKELLENNIKVREDVLAYLERCELFWKSNKGLLSKWREEIKTGNIPDDWISSRTYFR